MEDMQDAGLTDDPDRDCTLALDGQHMAWLTVKLDSQEDSEILDELMNNANIKCTLVDLTKDLPEYTYSLDLGE
jgi:hypothetical protein